MANQFKLNLLGFYLVRKAPKTIQVLDDIAKSIAAEANTRAGSVDGYRTSSQQGGSHPDGRWRTTVITATADSALDNSRNNTLIRSLDAGRQT